MIETETVIINGNTFVRRWSRRKKGTDHFVNGEHTSRENYDLFKKIAQRDWKTGPG